MWLVCVKLANEAGERQLNWFCKCDIVSGLLTFVGGLASQEFIIVMLDSSGVLFWNTVFIEDCKIYDSKFSSLFLVLFFAVM